MLAHNFVGLIFFGSFQMNIKSFPEFSVESFSKIKIIIGLGNPGTKYKTTRHNAGMIVIQELAEKMNVGFEQKSKSKISTLVLNGKKIILVLPETFMNNSSDAISDLNKFGKFNAEEILVIHDELEKKPYSFGWKFGGSSRGHNGLRSISQLVGENYLRLRVGIGRPENKLNVGNYVLDNFSESELINLSILADALIQYLGER